VLKGGRKKRLDGNLFAQARRRQGKSLAKKRRGSDELKNGKLRQKGSLSARTASERVGTAPIGATWA